MGLCDGLKPLWCNCLGISVDTGKNLMLLSVLMSLISFIMYLPLLGTMADNEDVIKDVSWANIEPDMDWGGHDDPSSGVYLGIGYFAAKNIPSTNRLASGQSARIGTPFGNGKTGLTSSDYTPDACGAGFAGDEESATWTAVCKEMENCDDATTLMMVWLIISFLALLPVIFSLYRRYKDDSCVTTKALSVCSLGIVWIGSMVVTSTMNEECIDNFDKAIDDLAASTSSKNWSGIDKFEYGPAFGMMALIAIFSFVSLVFAIACPVQAPRAVGASGGTSGENTTNGQGGTLQMA